MDNFDRYRSFSPRSSLEDIFFVKFIIFSLEQIKNSGGAFAHFVKLRA